MYKSALIALMLPLTLAGCGVAPIEYEYIEYPVMVLSQASLEFGEAEWGGSVSRTLLLSNQGQMPMGVGNIYIGDLEEGPSFSVSWDEDAIECPESSTDTGATAKGVDADTGGGGTTAGDDTGGGGDTDTDGGGDDTGDTDGGGGGGDATSLFVLDPGCQIPLTVTYTTVYPGEAYNALVIESIRAELGLKDDEDALPKYLDDPIHTRQATYLHGETTYEQGAIVVRPRTYDFGFVHPDGADDESPARIEIANVGDGPVTINHASLSETCPTSYTLENHFLDGAVLEGGDSTLAEVTFTPSDTNAARCVLTVSTTDPANAEVDVTLTGNTGSDPLNDAPTVAVRSPENGYRYSTIRPLELELNLFDADQPATSLSCRVKSAVIQDATLADCAASDESGHVFVSIPADSFEPGTDTLLVSVTDGSNRTSYASVSVVINSSYPADDDDGDGFSATGEPADCDDGNILTYPEAAEIYDAQDNDCDTEVDEGTIGADDDGDTFSEQDGDCNDESSSVYPGAPERGDAMDNDCDGTVDETTLLFDDDGDGYAEVNSDCDDDDPAVNPSAIELCDGIDNDCDLLRDTADGCIASDSSPMLVGNIIRMEQVACLEGEVIAMDVLAYDADNDTLIYAWSTGEGGGTFDNMAAPVVNYTAPQIPGDTANEGKNDSVYAVVTDDDGNTDWAFGKIAVWDGKTELYEPYKQAIAAEEDSAGCSSSGTGAAGGLALGAIVSLLARRRRA